MSTIWYQVIATLPDASTADEYCAWLRGGHVQAVVAAGADSATVVRLDATLDGPDGHAVHRVLSQYQFASRGAFALYVRDRAPALRAEGAAMFGARPGVWFERLVGEVL